MHTLYYLLIASLDDSGMDPTFYSLSDRQVRIMLDFSLTFYRENNVPPDDWMLYATKFSYNRPETWVVIIPVLQ